MNEVTSRRIHSILAITPLILLGLVAALLGFEWWRISIQADPDLIANYHFGSEAMIGHGGEKYRSAETYANSVLRTSIAILLATIPFVFAWKLNSRQILGIAYVIIILLLLSLGALANAL